MTAITSIMLLPSFLVGFFGQNFRVSDELNFHSGWLVSLGLIIAVSIAQIIFFRRKNWL
jgi:magnesium transporter